MQPVANISAGGGAANMFNSILFMATLRCYGDLGCYGVDGPFHSAHRPISVVPQPPETLNVTMHLLTRALADQSHVITWPFDVSQWRHRFRPSRRSVLVVHGFLESVTKPWVKSLVQALLRADDFNVLVVDWTVAAVLPYHQAVANARLVGAMLAQLISQLQATFGSRPETFHLVGHSLGAHVAGYAGARLAGRVGRITALDPAQPYFEMTPPAVRIDRSDAAFVDVIHTDIRPLLQGGMGIRRPIGHLDFYPNGGRKQPGCGGDVLTDVQSLDSDILQGMRHWLTCRHQRSVDLFTASLGSTCPFLAVTCPSWMEFRRGDCFDCGAGQCAPLGLKADTLRASITSRSNRPAKLYLRTSAQPPYCQFHHRISVSLTLPKDVRSLEGKLFVRLIFGRNERSRRMALLPHPSVPLSAIHHFTGVIEGTPNHKVTSLRLLWHPQTSDPLSYFNGRGQNVLLIRVQVENLESGSRKLFCLVRNTGHKLISGRTETLEPRHNCTSPEWTIGWSRDTNAVAADLD